MEKNLPHFELTRIVLNCCFEVMNELGAGFLENIYKNALLIAMRQKGLNVEVERTFEVRFRDTVIGVYRADLVVEKSIIIELKCCDKLLKEHQAQLFNYLKVSKTSVGLLINFKHGKLEWKRLQLDKELVFEEDPLTL